MMGGYRPRPVTVEAVQVPRAPGDLDEGTLTDWNRLTNWLERDRVRFQVRSDGIEYFTLEGWVFVKCGEWIIREIDGEYYSRSASNFEAMYEAVKEGE